MNTTRRLLLKMLAHAVVHRHRTGTDERVVVSVQMPEEDWEELMRHLLERN
jgi:hypothetical protein